MPSSFRKSSSLEPVRGLRFATLPLLEAFLRQLDIGIRCLLCLLDEPMEQHHLSALDREQCAADTIDQRCSNLPDGSPQVIDVRFADRPLELNVSNVLADRLALILRKTLQPLANGFAAGLRSEEDRSKPLRSRH